MTPAYRFDSTRDLVRRLRGMEVAMLTSSDSAGRLHARPMMTQQLDLDGDLWFFTGRDTDQADDIRARPQVNISSMLPREGRFISITGNAELVDDRAKAQQMWQPAYRAWFPGGVDDPDLVLLRVRIDMAESWEGEHASRIPGPLELAAGGPHWNHY